jgi:hypothetical protein
MMTVADGIDAGHWYSPEAVREMVEAERKALTDAICAALDLIDRFESRRGLDILSDLVDGLRKDHE